jgi:hypothetical protein
MIAYELSNEILITSLAVSAPHPSNHGSFPFLKCVGSMVNLELELTIKKSKGW